MFEIAYIFLFEACFEELDYIVLLFLIDFECVHIRIKDDKFYSELISGLIGPNDSLNNVINNVAIYYGADTHTSSGIWRCERVIRCDISVAYLTDRVDTPVEGVEIL